jgi:hypothetical protein
LLAGYVGAVVFAFTDEERREALFKKSKELAEQALEKGKPLFEEAVEKAKAALAK